MCHERKIRRKAEPKGIKRRRPRQEAKKKKGMKNGRVKDMRIRLQENIHHDLELLILLFLLRLLLHLRITQKMDHFFKNFSSHLNGLLRRLRYR